MITHIVLFKIKKGVTKKQIELFYKNLYKLQDKIPGIISISGGNNTSPENFKKGFSEGFVIKFKDKKSRDNYIPNKEHQNLVKKFISPIIKDCLVFDF